MFGLIISMFIHTYIIYHCRDLSVLVTHFTRAFQYQPINLATKLPTLKAKYGFDIYTYMYSPIFCIEFVSKLSRQSVSPSTDHKFASSLSVNCHDSQFHHRLPSMKFASSLSVYCHDSQFHRLPTISSTYGR